MATLHGDEQARRALDDLCQRYWQPVYAVVRSREPSVDTARDQTQAFFLYLLEKSALRRADRARGRFRTFLLTVLWRFLRDERKRAGAEKRWGHLEECALDDVEGEVTTEEQSISELLDREWALATMERAIEAVRGEVIAARGEEIWNVLRAFLPGSTEVPSMAVAAEALGVGEGGARTEVHRLRNRCREALRRELLRTVASPDDLDEEIEYLGRALRGAVTAGD